MRVTVKLNCLAHMCMLTLAPLPAVYACATGTNAINILAGINGIEVGTFVGKGKRNPPVPHTILNLLVTPCTECTEVGAEHPANVVALLTADTQLVLMRPRIDQANLL